MSEQDHTDGKTQLQDLAVLLVPRNIHDRYSNMNKVNAGMTSFKKDWSLDSEVTRTYIKTTQNLSQPVSEGPTLIMWRLGQLQVT